MAEAFGLLTLCYYPTTAQTIHEVKQIDRKIIISFSGPGTDDHFIFFLQNRIET